MLSSFLYTVNLFQPLDIIRIVASRRVLFELFLHNLESLRVIPAPYCFISLSLCFLGRFAWLNLIRFIFLLLLLLEFLELALHELIIGFRVCVLRAQLDRALVILEGFLPRRTPREPPTDPVGSRHRSRSRPGDLQPAIPAGLAAAAGLDRGDRGGSPST